MATSPSCHFVFRSAAIALCALGLSACDAFEQPKVPQAHPVGRFAIVTVPGIAPGTTETIEIDTATGSTWRLVKVLDPTAYDDIGWHPIADLTIEGRTPYYKHTPSMPQPQHGR